MAGINSKYLDRRAYDRYIEKGLLKDNEFKAHLKNLPDETSNAQWVEMDLHDAEIGEDLGSDDDLDNDEIEEEPSDAEDEEGA